MSWEENLAFGEMSEATIDTYIETLGIEVEPVGMELQLLGIDRFWRKDGVRISVEYKTDRQACFSSNLYCELSQIKTEGWAITSIAQILVYYVYPDQLYIFSMLDIKDRIAEWMNEYRKVTTTTGSGTGLLIPFEMLREELEPEMYNISGF